jgi:hypothetical protein
MKGERQMTRGGLFWGAVLIIVGLLLLLENLGLLDAWGVSVWNLLWPAFLILLGLYFLWGTLFGRRSLSPEEVTIPAADIQKAKIQFNHGAGRLTIAGGTAPSNLVEGIFSGGVDYTSKQDGDLFAIHLKVPPNSFLFFPFSWGTGYGHDWLVRLNTDVRLAVDLRTGANDARLDLSELQVTDLRLQTGASSTEVTLPTRAGYTRVEVESGAASVTLKVPANVAARIQASGGLSEIKVDQSRFPKVGNGYQSSEYDTAMNKADIRVETGVGSVKII